MNDSFFMYTIKVYRWFFSLLHVYILFCWLLVFIVTLRSYLPYLLFFSYDVTGFRFFFLLVCLHEGLSKSVNGCHIISEKFSLIIFFALFSPSSLYGILLDTSSQPLCLLNSPHVSIFTLLAFTLHSSVFP